MHGLGFNEDPQGYWQPSVSLLQHGLKPLSALWLLLGVTWQSLPSLLPQPRQQPHVTPAWTRAGVGIALTLLFMTACILYFHPGHFAMLTGMHQGRFLLADPSRGQQEWTASQLAHFWRGELLQTGPAEPRQARDRKR